MGFWAWKNQSGSQPKSIFLGILSKASRAFGALRMPVFRDSNMSLKTKRRVYKAVVLGVLL